MSISTNTVTRRVSWEITVVRPNYNLSTLVLQSPKVIFTSQPISSDNSVYSNDLIAYQYKNTIKEIDPPFSLTLTPNVLKGQKTWLDVIEVRDLVIFSEFSKIKYVGVVTDKYYTAAISPEGTPRRLLNISGKSLASLLASTPLIMDLHIWTGAGLPVDVVNKEFLASLNVSPDKSQRLGPLLARIYDKYFTLWQSMGQIAGVPTSGFQAIMDKFLDLNNEMNSNVVALYPLALSVFRVGKNNLWNIWRSIVPGPYYELFGKWIPSEDLDTVKQAIVSRKSPFDPMDWNNLKLNYIPNVAINKLDLGQTDSEVYTYYQALLPGALINEEQVKAFSEYANGRKIDTDLWNIYGYRPLFIDFQYFNRSQTGVGGLSNTLQSVTNSMFEWFKRNREFYSGTISFQALPDGPAIGERLALFDQAQFYIEELTNSWTYGKSLTTTLTLSRGCRYDGTGSPTEPLQQVGYLLSSGSVIGQKTRSFKYE